MSKKPMHKSAARRKASNAATLKTSKPSATKILEATYKTQGTIASVSTDSNNRISFTIDPVEPYDFPVKEHGETKKYILFQPVSKETQNGGAEIDKSAKSTEKLWKVSPNTEFSVSAKEDKKQTGMNFGDMISLKQNRSKVELEVAESELEKRSDSSQKGTTTKPSGCSLTVSKIAAK